ncbi:MAG: diguanylate cyclase [Rhodospirillaceae bacterium]|nr:diguanylate cyclase [Rhodospirillaceae bacterium]
MDKHKASDDLLERLNRLSIEFGETLAGRVKEVRRIWSLIPAAPSTDEARTALIKIHDIVHALAGSGKSFGFPLVSSAAAPLDGLFRLLREQSQSLTSEESAQIELLIQSLEQATLAPREAIALPALREDGAAPGSERGPVRLLIAAGSADDPDATALCAAIRAFGYPCDIVASARDIPREVALANQPAVVYADISAGGERLAFIQRTSILAQLPLILASTRAGFADRLQAVRLGATLFLAKPFEPDQLVQNLAGLAEQQGQRPYRVVIAEDEPALANFYQLTLEHAGIETRVVRQPSKLLETLSGFDPDLILMDLYMPECSGLELAQIVRQFPAYTTVPILFLSTESRLDLQLRARHLGADDFLPKPLHPGQLISAVVSRANRYRDLKKLTDRDSLTGLLNHSNILRILEREIIAAERAKTPLSLCMVDIDHFKRVNDTYGHVVGDQVIVKITHMLRNRLRRIDYIGRYGGEEFAVVMPNTDAEGAKAVMQQLRRAAEAMEHHSEQGPFSVTFSCGVAAFPAHARPGDLVSGADAALYAAKRAGRNRVEIASAP